MKPATRVLMVLALAIPLALASLPMAGWSAVMPGSLDRAALVQDFARLDRAYIPVLALTSQEKAQPSSKAMATFAPVWQRFQAAWRGAVPADSQWEKDFSAVAGHISRAADVIATGKNLTRAHEELEHVRLIFMALRGRHGVAYFVDRLTHFHEDMEAVVLAAKGKTPETLSPADVARIRQHLAPAKATWKLVMADTPDQPVFGFSQGQLNALNQVIQEEWNALLNVEEQLEANQPQALIKAAVGIKPPFSRIFMMFGDFDGLKSA